MNLHCHIGLFFLKGHILHISKASILIIVICYCLLIYLFTASYFNLFGVI